MPDDTFYQFKKIASKRRSCRSFERRELEIGLVRELLEVAVTAPSAGNLQPWRFVVVADAATKSRLASAAYGQQFVAEAPVVVVVVAVPEESARFYGRRGRDLYSIQDTAAATQNLLLAASARGLGACWVGAFDEAAVSKVLSLPRGWRPVALVPLGWPGHDESQRTSRKPLDQVVIIHSSGGPDELG